MITAIRIKSYNKSFLLKVLFVLILSSCISPRFIDVEVLKPAETNYPFPVSHLFLINDASIIYNPAFHSNINYYKVYWDTFNVALKNQLQTSPLFENTQIKILNYSDLKFELQNYTFKERKDMNVCFIYPFYISDSLSNIVDFNYWYRQMNLVYSLKLEFLNLAFLDESKKTYFLKDTIIWESPFYSAYNTSVNAVYDLDLYKKLAVYSVESFSSKIAPFWIKEERTLYYNGNKYMKRGYKNFIQNNLDKAISNWQLVYEKGASYLSSSAAYNLAVCYETMDSIKLANTWINNAASVSKNYQVLRYKKYLNNRLVESEKLNSQLSNKPVLE